MIKVLPMDISSENILNILFRIYINVPTPEDLRLREVYGDWVHGNPGTHLDGGVSEDG